MFFEIIGLSCTVSSLESLEVCSRSRRPPSWPTPSSILRNLVSQKHRALKWTPRKTSNKKKRARLTLRGRAANNLHRSPSTLKRKLLRPPKRVFLQGSRWTTTTLNSPTCRGMCQRRKNFRTWWERSTSTQSKLYTTQASSLWSSLRQKPSSTSIVWWYWWPRSPVWAWCYCSCAVITCENEPLRCSSMPRCAGSGSKYPSRIRRAPCQFKSGGHILLTLKAPSSHSATSTTFRTEIRICKVWVMEIHPTS